ncbi:hypothetical protein BDV40DRAFT_260493 [Aspergillus tamarii]|uniref:Uncharacterized protein n=1 Tax=Aspergillus tamarii TaxID=41984 RepID=A0A5N6V0F3_ASPTM|nr:hypothetical protein BDV40DRAFT_260493 [Aspergillus tamarii]
MRKSVLLPRSMGTSTAASRAPTPVVQASNAGTLITVWLLVVRGVLRVSIVNQPLVANRINDHAPGGFYITTHAANFRLAA